MGAFIKQGNETGASLIEERFFTFSLIAMAEEGVNSNKIGARRTRLKANGSFCFEYTIKIRLETRRCLTHYRS